MKIQNYLLLLGMLFITLQTSFAQIPLEVSTNVLYPYPTQYSVWMSEAESFTVTVANNSNTDFEFFIRTELEGTDLSGENTFIKISEDFRPLGSFTLAAGEVRTFMSSEIQNSYANMSQSDIFYSDNIPIEDINGELPSGEYRICTQVIEFNEDITIEPAPLSPIDCSDFFTTGQASIELVSPFEFESLSSENPTFFDWTVNGIDFNDVADYSYQLKIYEIDSLQAIEESVYDLVGEGSAIEFFISETTSELQYIVDPTLGSFPFNPANTYAAQVTVVETGGIFFENEGKSNIMVYNSSELDDTVPQDDSPLTENQVDCFENCHYTLDGNTTPLADENPTTIEVGNFTMTEIEISNVVNNKFSGIGRIAISWLNDVFIKVNFNNIKINSSGRMYEGIVKADVASMPDIVEEAANLINTTRMIGGMIGANAAIDLPIGIDQNIGGFNLTVAITELEFTATDCYANTACNFHIPALGEDSWISLETTEICMHPGGFGNEFIMHMGPDRPINSHGDILVNFKGSESTQPDQVKEEACYIEMDCNGVKALSVKAEINFPENMFLPDSSDGIPGEGTVKGNLSFTIDLAQDAEENVYAVLGEDFDGPTDKGLHFLASVDIDPFQIKGVPGWGFELSEAWFDASEVSNIPDIVMPEGHEDIVDGELANVWTGFYLKKGMIALPQEIMGSGGRLQLDVNHGIIDPQFSMNIALMDLFPINAGNLDGWGLSMDSLYMTINQNHLTEGGFSGQLRFPLAEEDQYLRYTAMIGEAQEPSEDEGVQYTFNVSPDGNLTFPFLISEVYLAPDSYIEGRLQPGSPTGTYFDSFITGGINLDTDLFSTKEDYEGVEFHDFKLPFIDFGFKYHSDNGFSEAHFGLVDDGSELEEGEIDFSGMGYGVENNKESMVGLPITMEEMSIVGDGNGGQSFQLKPFISLSPGETSFGAGATVEIPSSIVEIDNIKSLKLNGFQIKGIEINIERMGIGFYGELEVYKDMNASGVGSKGIRGELAVALPLGIGMKMAADFGSICTDSTAVWNTEKNYPYWYFDGMIYFGENGGIPIAGPIGLYGIGGGIQYNMTRSQYSSSDGEEISAEEVAADLALINVDDELAAGKDVDASTLRKTGTVPTPLFGTMGLKMAATIGTCPVSALVNMDVSVLAEFTTGENMSLSLLSIDGDAFIMTPLGERSDPQVWAGLSLTYSNPGPGEYAFDGQFVAYANVRPAGISLLRGAGAGNLVGDVSLHASKLGGKSLWYLHVGSPESRFGLEIGFEDMLELRAEGYFMLGQNLPTELPIPEEVAFLFGEKNSKGKNKLTSGTINGSVDRSASSTNNAANGSGLAFGAEVSVTVDVNALGIYAMLKIYLGFDINITQNPGLFCSNTGSQIGVNGWYGQGQIYGGLEGALGFRVRALGKDHDLELFNLKAAMMLSGGGPNPFYADGRVGVQIRVLGGLIKCSKTISAEVGEKCVPEYGNPFGGVPIIAETFPTDGDKKVSVFTIPKVTFSLPMNEITELTILDEDGNPGPYFVEPIYQNVKLKDEDGNVLELKEEALIKNGKMLKLYPKESLLSRDWYTVEMTIKAKEYPYGPDGSSNFVREYGQVWKQDTVFTFKTGKLVDLNDGIEFAIPLRGQRYFLQDEVYAATDKLNLLSEQSELFLQDDESYSYDYFVRYLCEDGDEPLIVDIPNPISASSIDWNLPEFKNDKNYCMQLIRKQTAKGYLGLVQGALLLQTYSTVDNEFQVRSLDTLELGEAINPVEDLGAGETALVTYFFKTSKYNNLDEKMDGAKFATNNTYSYYNDELTLNTNENFDEFDTKGLKTEDGENTLEPLIRLFDPMEYAGRGFAMPLYTNYYSSKVEDIMWRFVKRCENKGIAQVFSLGTNLVYPDLNIGYSGNPEKPLHRKVTDYDDRLNDEAVIDKFAETDFSSMLTTMNNASISSSYFGSGKDVTIEFVTFDQVKEDAEALYEWAEDIRDESLIYSIVILDEEDGGFGYPKFEEHYLDLWKYSKFNDFSIKGSTYYIDIYHGKFRTTPISDFKGFNKQELKFTIE